MASDRFFDADVRPPRGGWRAVIDGRDFPPEGQPAHSEAEAFGALKRWRENNGTFTGDAAISAELWSYWRSREPQRATAAPAPEVARTAVRRPTGFDGSELWRRLHRWALAGGGATIQEEKMWLAGFAREITCPECQQHWFDLRKSYPFPFTGDAEDRWSWTWHLHNLVNRSLGRKEMPKSEARSLYV